jgi:hypothetical protein
MRSWLAVLLALHIICQLLTKWAVATSLLLTLLLTIHTNLSNTIKDKLRLQESAGH